jgi:type I site-specific deoxyribonuclease, hsdR family
MGKLNNTKEAQLEQNLIDLLCAQHGQWTFRSDLKTEEDLWNNLRNIIEIRNKSELNDNMLTDSEFKRIRSEILANTKTPFEAAKWLRGEKGKCSVVLERDNGLGRIELIIYSSIEKNGGFSSYEIVHQIAKNKSNLEERSRRFDITLLIGGLPIIQIELKTAIAKDGVKQAYYQIEKYIDEGTFSNTIFQTLQLYVMSNEQTTRYMAAAPKGELQEKFMFGWRTRDNTRVENINEFAKQVLNIPRAHELVSEYMILSEEVSSKILMVLHPYQIHAIEAIFEAASKHQSGYIWHATGSGKTITSFVSTKLLAQKSGIDRTIMLLDRKDLDNQTTSEFTKFASAYSTGVNTNKNTLIVGTGNTKELSNALKQDSSSNVVIVTTRQKLNKAVEYLQEKEPGRLANLRGKHIVFIVDECHRAISAQNMDDIKKVFPKSTWFGFTGTPIFEENKKSSDGQYARTTHDQYGEVLHRYTIKNALEDGSVLGFQVEHESTIHQDELANVVYRAMRSEEKNINYTDEELVSTIESMKDIDKEQYLQSTHYESDDHIQSVIRKILSPNNAYSKFVFKDGKPTMSAILTTSSIDMAKRYYKAIKKFTADKNWLETQFPNNPLRQGAVMNDPDFPRVAITYSLEENTKDSALKETEMAEIIDEYNQMFGTSWSIESINRYNGDINNRLARKKGEFKEFGKHLDLVIVVDRLLTGFDAPRCQTLFVDRNLQYAGLIQAFSRTNRTYKGKDKGLITTFRKPATMKEHVYAATRLYSQTNNNSSLIYPTYEESKKKFNAAYTALVKLEAINPNNPITEYAPVSDRINFVKCFQDLNKAYRAIASYDDFNIELDNDKHGTFSKKIAIIEDNIGLYNTIKASLKPDDKNEPGIELIDFFDSSTVQTYTVDKSYIDALLSEYEANSQDTRAKIEDALTKLNKSESVRTIYKHILDDIDTQVIDKDSNLLKIKREYFTKAYDSIVESFASIWCVDPDELMVSVNQSTLGEDIYNKNRIVGSANYPVYVQQHPDSDPFSYPQHMIEAWEVCLFDEVIPLRDELK